jgi:hypothetical protein
MKKKPWSNSIYGGKAIFVSLSIALTVGCAGPRARMYKGPELPKAEVAVLEGHYVFVYFGLGFYFGGYEIITVDKEAPGEVGISGLAHKVELLPGWHHVLIRSFSNVLIPGGPGAPGGSSDSESLHELEFNAEAGRQYKIKKQGSLLTIVDTQADAMVASMPLKKE